MSRPSPTTLAAVLGLLTLSPAAPGADWPEWGGRPQRNMVSSETGLPVSFTPAVKVAGQETLEATPGVCWARKLGTETFGTPVIAAGRVLVGTNRTSLDSRYTGNRGTVLCLEEATGKVLWQLSVPRPEDNRNLARGQSLGICASPTVEGGRVYVSGWQDILCLDLAGQSGTEPAAFQDQAQYVAGAGKAPIPPQKTDGKILWRFDIPTELRIDPHDALASAPLVDGDVVYVSTGNGVNQTHKVRETPDAPCLIALDKKTGRLAAADGEKIGRKTFHGQWSSPSLGTVNGKPQVLFGGGDGICYAFEPAKPGSATLKKIWSFDANLGNPKAYRSDGGPSEIVSTPVCADNRVYVTIGQDWTHRPYGRGRLCCIDATGTGDLTATGRVWVYEGMGWSMATPAVADGLIYVTDLDGRIHCVDAITGRSVWVYETKVPIWSAALVADGKVYVGTARGRIVALAAGRELKVLGETELKEPLAGAPVAANGRLYVATYKTLHAVGNK